MTLGWLKPEALVRRKAARLLVRLDLDPSPHNRERLERWRNSDPRHADALAKAERVLKSAGLLGQSPLAGGRRFDPAVHAHRVPARLAIAASLAAALLLIPALYLLVSKARPAGAIEAVMLRTGPGETRKVSLADGSTLVLAGSSEIKVELGPARRSAALARGRARFSIARRPAPFTVRAGDTAVRLAEGVLDVSRTAAGVHVGLLAGTAELVSAGGHGANRRLSAPAAVDRTAGGGERTIGGAEALPVRGPARLAFENARLADIAASANRHGQIRILISDPGVAGLRATGAYDSSDATGLARSLAAAFGLRVREDEAGNLLLERGPGAR